MAAAAEYNEKRNFSGRTAMKPKPPANPLLELLANVRQAEQKKHAAKLANKRSDPQNRWMRFNHFVWDKRRGEG